MLAWLAVTVLGATLANACSATGDGATGGSGTSGAGNSGSTGSSGTLATGAGGSDIDASGATGSGGLDPDAACATVSSQATAQKQPADIVIAVDTSGSMDEESAEVQQNLNNFAAIIVGSGIDVHVVLIADASVCIPPPLGAGCPSDELLPAYRHVVQTVNSNDGLQVILSTYPQWKDSLRPGASKTIAIVSDDNSSMSAQDFTNQLLALDPPTFQGFKFDAIISFESPDVCTACFFNCAACSSACCNQALFCEPISADEGTVYKQLVQQTGGVIGDLCSQDFDPVFQDMATAVVSQSTISCFYDIPAIPDGGTLDPGKVNVSYTPGMGSSNTIGYVPGGAADCGAQNGGWYYDDPQSPTQIILCPSTCTAVQGDPGGKLDVVFGCDTVIAVPD